MPPHRHRPQPNLLRRPRLQLLHTPRFPRFGWLRRGGLRAARRRHRRYLIRLHVLRALGLTTAKSEASIRFSFGRFTSSEDIESAAYLVGEALATLSLETASRPR